MKIGIITFHCADNYGAVLQTLALYRKTMEFSDSSEIYIVDYRPKSIMESYSLLKGKNIRSLVSSILQFPFSARRKFNFDKFRNSRFKFLSLKEINCLDCLICGSDQIWNSKITNGLDPHFFGAIGGFKGKLMAYAASDGGKLTKDEIKVIRPYLEKFEFVSVREKSMLALLEECRNTIPVVLDPVFLHDRAYWQTIAEDQKHRNYILIYQLSYNDKLFKDAYLLAAQTGKSLIEISYSFPYRKFIKTKHKVSAATSLPDFLSLFMYADYILTNSFHGTAFSIIFNKGFYTYYDKIDDSKNKRIENILLDFNLQDRYIQNIDYNNVTRIDYSAVNILLEGRRHDSVEFLKSCLSNDYTIVNTPPPPPEYAVVILIILCGQKRPHK